MNNQEIEKAIRTLEELKSKGYEKFEVVRNPCYSYIEIEPILTVLRQQMNNEWIPITQETNPKKSDIYLVTFEEGENRYVERFYFSLINGWMMPVSWQDEGRIDRMLFWCNMPQPFKEV